MTGEVIRWADQAMYRAEADPLAAKGELVRPQVTLVYMTPNPLRVMAAAAELYVGRVCRHPEQISEATARHWFSEMTKTRLAAPLEFVDMHFLFEGVTRAFTHQLVRQRTAVFVQESQRFAVKENAYFEVAMPPSIAALKEDHPARMTWMTAVKSVSKCYMTLVNAGIPAEDARGLLPTNITTKVHYKTNLRNLVEHAGNRLSAQAQWEWKQVFAGILDAIRNYKKDAYGEWRDWKHERWQLELIATLFKPICFRTGRCEFRADSDRYCVIRERVMAHYERGEGPEQWDDIDPREPLVEGAARRAPGTVR